MGCVCGTNELNVAEFMFYVCGGESFVHCMSNVDVNAVFASNFFAYLPNMIWRGICSDEEILFIL
jgi:hypothetical protein